ELGYASPQGRTRRDADLGGRQRDGEGVGIGGVRMSTAKYGFECDCSAAGERVIDDVSWLGQPPDKDVRQLWWEHREVRAQGVQWVAPPPRSSAPPLREMLKAGRGCRVCWIPCHGLPICIEYRSPVSKRQRRLARAC